jgi:hypothetical protein
VGPAERFQVTWEPVRVKKTLYSKELERVQQMSIRNLRKLDGFPQNRCPLLLNAL